jgi:hypothetical protein
MGLGVSWRSTGRRLPIMPVKPIPEPTRPKAMNITPKTMQDLAVLVG